MSLPLQTPYSHLKGFPNQRFNLNFWYGPQIRAGCWRQGFLGREHNSKDVSFHVSWVTLVVCAFYELPCQRVGVRGVGRGKRAGAGWALELPFPFVAEGAMEKPWHVNSFDYFDCRCFDATV